MEKKRFAVTQEDIDTAGGSHNAGRCPFAVALRRVFPLDYKISVTPADIVLWRDGQENVYWQFSSRASEVIKRYDHSDQMVPGTYVITRAAAPVKEKAVIW
jgi:hypothetical protein